MRATRPKSQRSNPVHFASARSEVSSTTGTTGSRYRIASRIAYSVALSTIASCLECWLSK